MLIDPDIKAIALQAICQPVGVICILMAVAYKNVAHGASIP